MTRPGADGVRDSTRLSWELDRATELMSLITREQAQAAAIAAQAEHRQAELTRLMMRMATESGSADHQLETLIGLDVVRTWLAETARAARSQALAFAPGGPQPSHVLAAGRPLDEQALARGVRLRTIYLTSATHDVATRRHVRDLSLLGAQFRTVASLPLRLLIVDGEVALLPLRVDDSAFGAFVVRNRETLVALTALFEGIWAQALPFGERANTSGDHLSDQERLLLVMLADGAHDNDVARALGVSLRTLRRMVAALFVRLGARSRFQAGVNAVKAGWLT